MLLYGGISFNRKEMHTRSNIINFSSVILMASSSLSHEAGSYKAPWSMVSISRTLPSHFTTVGCFPSKQFTPNSVMFYKSLIETINL